MKVSFMAHMMSHREDISTYCYLNILEKITCSIKGLIIRT
jgi:hypothetical protein